MCVSQLILYAAMPELLLSACTIKFIDLKKKERKKKKTKKTTTTADCCSDQTKTKLVSAFNSDAAETGYTLPVQTI